MEIDTNLGYDYYIDILASIIDNPLDSIHNGREVTEAIASAFGKSYSTVRGSAHKIFLFDSRDGKWEIVS